MVNVKKRMAVLVGCNYANTQYELHGCINDVVAMQEVLVHRFGFESGSIEVLTDEPGSKVKPTGANIKNALSKIIDKADSGDVLFFHYSGHGTRVSSKHHTKQDEAIVPCDFNLITDVDFRQLVNRLPKGATFTFLSDSCHSGGLIDKEKEQIGPNIVHSTAQNIKKLDIIEPNFKPKNISFESLLDHLASLTKRAESEIGAHLVALFGDDASPKFHGPRSSMDQPNGPTHELDLGILLSGCQPNETSADMPQGGPSGKAHGAFSFAVQSVLKETKGPISNKEVVMLAREMLKKEGVEEQHPCLYCSDDNVNMPFLLGDMENKK